MWCFLVSLVDVVEDFVAGTDFLVDYSFDDILLFDMVDVEMDSPKGEVGMECGFITRHA